ncbi:hypothetical protein Tco_0938744 [Tanacetum coccineum]|uniref:Uncharacterized protein n=1 Tax=Tanacetum coccineum TaxID=301880 RepID=A0ABQ5DPA2_9ASTR
MARLVLNFRSSEFLVSSDGRRPFELVYHGQFDDSRPSNNVRVTGRDLSVAIDCVLSGQPVPPNQKPSLENMRRQLDMIGEGLPYQLLVDGTVKFAASKYNISTESDQTTFDTITTNRVNATKSTWLQTSAITSRKQQLKSRKLGLKTAAYECLKQQRTHTKDSR